MSAVKLAELFQKEAPGLTPLAIAVFMIIASKGKASFKTLGKELEVPQANILRAIAALEDQNLVFVTETGPLKKTAVLTGKGTSLSEKIKNLAQDV